MIQTVKFVALVNGLVDSIQSCELDLPEGSVPVVVGDKVQVNLGDVYSNGAFSINPDAAKLIALKEAKQAAIDALESADDKAAILKALTDAQTAVDVLPEVIK